MAASPRVDLPQIALLFSRFGCLNVSVRRSQVVSLAASNAGIVDCRRKLINI